jgi:hypothetical protein
MNKVIIPERRSSMNDSDNFYSRRLSNGAIECYSKEYYNSNFTRKSEPRENSSEKIKKDILLLQIKDSLK